MQIIKIVIAYLRNIFDEFKKYSFNILATTKIIVTIQSISPKNSIFININFISISFLNNLDLIFEFY